MLFSKIVRIGDDGKRTMIQRGWEHRWVSGLKNGRSVGEVV